MAFSLPALPVTGTTIDVSWGIAVRAALNEGSAAKVTTAGDMPYATALGTLTRLPIGSTGQSLIVSGGLPSWGASLTQSARAMKTSSQAFTSNTTFADIAAQQGGVSSKMAFAIAANEEWVGEFTVDVNVISATGGVKMQLTGPSAPTAVEYGLAGTGFNGASTDNTTLYGTATAFSTSLALTGSQGEGYYVTVRFHIINGANAGTVTLQGAQSTSSANATTFSKGHLWALRLN